MSIRTSKVFLRFVLTLISIQFLAPSIIWNGEAEIIPSTPLENTVQASVQKLIPLSVILDRIIEEREDERHKLLSLEEFDFSVFTFLKPKVSISQYTFSNRTNQFDLQPPLFILYCTYLV